MAKKKNMKQNQKKGVKYPIELKGILFILIGVIGFLGFNANILGTIFKGFAMFLMGTFDFVVLSVTVVVFSVLVEVPAAKVTEPAVSTNTETAIKALVSFLI